MSPTASLEHIVHKYGETLAAHGARLTAGEDRQKDTAKKLDRIIWLVITTLLATVFGLIKHQ